MSTYDQIINLEIAMQLRGLGLDVPCSYYWRVEKSGKKRTLLIVDRVESSLYEFYPAYTVAELGLLLQDGMRASWKTSFGHWRCRYEVLGTSETSRFIDGENEANARGNMLVFLLVKKEIDLKKLNNER